jgi:hypothetical protein
MFIGALFGWIAGWLLKAVGMAPVLVHGASQLGLTLDAEALPSLAAFLGFVGGAFKTRFTVPSAPPGRPGKQG